MKIIKKLVISILLTCSFICFLSANTYAMSDLLRQEIGYKDDRDEDMPKEADVKIDGSKLIKTIKLPYINLSFEEALYGHPDLIDINFFKNDTENTDDFWLVFRKAVRSSYRIAIYAAFAVMLAIFIYEAILLVIDAIKNNTDAIDIQSNDAKGKIVVRRLKDKIFIQEWIIGMICLGLLTTAITFVINFSDYLLYDSPVGSERKGEGLDNQKIRVLVEGGSFPIGEISIIGDETETTEFKRYMFIGDSRVRQMSHLYTETDDIFISEYGAGVDWLETTGIPEAEKKLSKGMNVIIWMGTNDYWNQKQYIKLINSKVSSWGSKGVTITVGTIRTKSI